MLKPAARRRLEFLHAWRETAAAELKLDPALVCTKNLMGELAKANPRSVTDLNRMNEIKNWQKTVFGKEIVGALKGATQ